LDLRECILFVGFLDMFSIGAGSGPQSWRTDSLNIRAGHPFRNARYLYKVATREMREIFWMGSFFPAPPK
jgi:hypothetical protein